MRMIIKSTIVFFCFGLSCSAATTLYNLSATVLDGNTGENTYISANGSGSGLVYTPGTPSLTLTLPGSGAFAQLIGNFSSTTLTSIGDSITFSYVFKASSGTTFSGNDSTFRVGIFNSNGSPVTGNTAGSDTNASTDTGYAGLYRGGSGTNGSANVFAQRSGSNAVLMASATLLSANINNTSPTLTQLGVNTANQQVTGSFSLTMISGGVRLTSIINGGTAQTVDDTSGIVSSFDEFCIFGLSGASNPTLTFTTLSVTYTSAAVPEPSSTALFAGLFGLAGAFLLRRRRR